MAQGATVQTGSLGGERLRSLDLFRGLMVLGMMMVDWPGSWSLPRFALFEHSPWTGITAPDFIFPSFLFSMGVAIPYALQARKDAGAGLRSLHVRILRRGLLLFAIGYAMNILFTLPDPLDFRVIRIPGTLQRFGLVYPVVAMAWLHLSPRRLVGVGLAILLGYWALLTLIPVPGYGHPNLYLLPAGEVTPNLASWLDKVVLGHRVYTYPFDPEGILNTLPAIGSGLLGVLCGQWLRKPVPMEARANALFAWGVVLVVAGYFWGMVFPLCKNLWSSSFIVFMGGFSMLLFASLFWLVDIQNYRSRLLALPRWFGENALGAIVIFSGIDVAMSLLPVARHADRTRYVLKDFLFDHLFRSWAPDRHASWLYSVVAILALSMLFRWFHRHHILIKV